MNSERGTRRKITSKHYCVEIGVKFSVFILCVGFFFLSVKWTRIRLIMSLGLCMAIYLIGDYFKHYCKHLDLPPNPVTTLPAIYAYLSAFPYPNLKMLSVNIIDFFLNR